MQHPENPPFHASARLISPVILLPPLPDVDTDPDSPPSGPRLQSQMYDAATNFPAPRKQNIACDACRSRKVRCHQVPGQDKCSHCQAKNYPCTHYVQQATQERKRTASGTSSRNKTRGNSGGSSLDSTTSTNASGSATPSPGPSSALALSFSPPPSLGSPVSGHPNATIALLRWIFSPTFQTSLPEHVGGAPYQASRAVVLAAGRAATESFRNIRKPTEPDWGDVSKKLSDDAFLTEFAYDLIEVYMQICHTRQPILDPKEFRARFRHSLPTSLIPSQSITADSPTPPGNFEPIPPALLAVVIAWGSKFSEHPLILMDRNQNGGRSRISRALVTRAFEIAEAERVYRITTPENIITCMVIEGIQSHAKTDADRFSKFWVDNAIRMMIDLQVNRQPQGQGALVFCWWIACLSDAIGAAYLRRKPLLDDDDYDTPHLAASSFGSPSDPVLPAGVQAAYLSWYSSLHALAVIIRRMCRILWIPTTESDGIPYDRLMSLVAMYSSWRDEHLDRVGVPSNFEADWDFVAAVTACSSDATFHLMWIILSQALEEFGIKELNVLRSADPTTEVPEFEALKQNINEEATHGALRIAGLAGVLTNNGYLRLDPNALHYGIYAAGMAYEDALDQAAELEQIYAQTLAAGQHVQAQQSPISPGHGLQFSPTDMGQAQAMAMAFSSPQHDFSGSAFGGQGQLSPFSPSYPHDLYQP
ncbi:hypothetical protein M407DRAFT_26355 [Tulasnella calospora MUT 4182]|uniref:Zn(2)-C6 fungal-type domain-containing protein n=1 Tax=Tulasnella calospora MUT 4182 TaxID=1051891 RepID=A0A0C3Q567_9AGAM|nr:hypothetical protein M407DRAFT_26355 [Tulasnella calospora MUT 4182]